MPTVTQTCSLDDCNGDEVPDFIQIVDGTLEDCDGNGVPDDCERTDSFAASEPRTPINSATSSNSTSAAWRTPLMR